MGKITGLTSQRSARSGTLAAVVSQEADVVARLSLLFLWQLDLLSPRVLQTLERLDSDLKDLKLEYSVASSVSVRVDLLSLIELITLLAGPAVARATKPTMVACCICD